MRLLEKLYSLAIFLACCAFFAFFFYTAWQMMWEPTP